MQGVGRGWILKGPYLPGPVSPLPQHLTKVAEPWNCSPPRLQTPPAPLERHRTASETPDLFPVLFSPPPLGARRLVRKVLGGGSSGNDGWGSVLEGEEARRKPGGGGGRRAVLRWAGPGRAGPGRGRPERGRGVQRTGGLGPREGASAGREWGARGALSIPGSAPAGGRLTWRPQPQ